MSKRNGSYMITFTISRIYDKEPEISVKDLRESAEQDFWDDARHCNLNPKIKWEKVK